jgi:hypothetical protein
MIHSPTDAATARSAPRATSNTGPPNRIRVLQTLGQSVWLAAAIHVLVAGATKQKHCERSRHLTLAVGSDWLWLL